MSDFVELGLEAADHLIDNHFDKIPNELFSPRGALHNMRHRRQKHPMLDRIEGRPASSPSQSPNETSATSPKSSNEQRKSSRKDSEGTESEGGYDGDEEKPIGNKRGDRSRSSRRRERQDPYYNEAEKRTQNPRDYDPECLDKDPSSPKNPYWAQQQPPHHTATIPTRLSSSSLYVSHPADPSYSTHQPSPISPTTGPGPPYTQANISRKRSIHTPTPAVTRGLDDPYYRGRQRSPPPNSPVTRGAPNPRYDARSTKPPPNVDPYYPAQQHRSPSPTPPPPQPSISYAAAAYSPYPYPSPAAAAAAFGAERPYEYGHEPYRPPHERPSRSRSRSRSRHRSSHRRRHRHRHRHRPDRPNMPRRASSTGDTPNDPARSRSHSHSRSTHRSPQRPLPRRRASSTSALRASRSRSPSAPPRKRDFGLPSKLSRSERALGASGAGALAGGFLAQEVGARLLRRKTGSQNGGGGGGGRDPLVWTLVGALVGGVGANLVVGKEERRRRRMTEGDGEGEGEGEGERGGVRGWMEDVRGERRRAVLGWKADGGD